MKRKKYSILIVSVAALLILNLYDRLVLTPVRMTDFRISPVTVFCGTVGRPLFWLLIGILISSLLAEVLLLNKDKKWLCRALLICGGILLVIYGVLVSVHLLWGEIHMPQAFVVLLVELMNMPVLFFIPGMLIGISMDGLREKQK